MKAVLDANVVISAAIQPGGVPRVAFEAWECGEFTWVTSLELLEELEGALAYPRVQRRLRWTDDQRAVFISRVRDGCERVVAASLNDPIVELDRDDDILFATAIAGAVQYIVTGDRQVLAVRSYAGIEIITPRDFVTLLRRSR